MEFTLVKHAPLTVLFAMTGPETAILAKILTLWAFMIPLDVLVPYLLQLREMIRPATNFLMDATNNHLAGMMNSILSQAYLLKLHILVSMILGTMIADPAQRMRINVLTRP
jgi:hypothetical protein